ncbi:MAG: hypothetical protein HRO68_06110 [Nitrosopumilus sp.]|nr:hypothetical protein [Nitrosopumilus sp.]
MNIVDQEELRQRGELLSNENINGVKFILVSLFPASNPTEAHLEIHFFNEMGLRYILNAPDPKEFFTITGGTKIFAGENGQIKITNITGNPSGNFLAVIIKQLGHPLVFLGDYSTYVLEIKHNTMDKHPCFSKMGFKFRPGCFNIDCSPAWSTLPKPDEQPTIDYLAKDFDLFRHILISEMMRKVPGWNLTSRASLDGVLLDLFCAAVDELSDYQDRVMNEAYLGLARKRVSISRHARLMDYHIHQGNQASTWLAINTEVEMVLTRDFEVGSDSEKNENSVLFRSNLEKFTLPSNDIEFPQFSPILNGMKPYTWGNTITLLPKGSTYADLSPDFDANKVRDWINDGTIKHLLIQEESQSDIGHKIGTNPKRQLLRLRNDSDYKAKVEIDPYTKETFLRVWWIDEDKLKFDFYFDIKTKEGEEKEDELNHITHFYGNLLQVYHGNLGETIFLERPDNNPIQSQFYYERMELPRLGTICKLPHSPLAYKYTPSGGEVPPLSTLEVNVVTSFDSEYWTEVPNLIHSRSLDPHFIVETDEQQQSIIRFGNGINGKELPQNATVVCTYKIGNGISGNLGSDSLTNFSNTPQFNFCWNPFDVVDGREPEPVEEIIRRVPEAFRQNQNRAITISDYIKLVSEIENVSKVWANYRWTGSWRTVQVIIDPVNSTTISDELYDEIIAKLESVRLIGEDSYFWPNTCLWKFMFHYALFLKCGQKTFDRISSWHFQLVIHKADKWHFSILINGASVKL